MEQTFTKYVNSITTLSEANDYIRRNYGPNAYIRETVIGGKTKFAFVNIQVVSKYPHKLKSVAAAMNVLFAHERGWIGYKKNLKAHRKKQVDNNTNC